MSLLLIPASTKICLALRARWSCSALACSQPTKGSKRLLLLYPPSWLAHPNVVYIIVGATHPHVLRQDGETYRLSLQRLAQELGVAGNVIFYNRFVSLEELIEFISAADIYITPYLNPAQITSGTLAYTLGCGQSRHFDAVLVCGRDAGQ